MCWFTLIGCVRSICYTFGETPTADRVQQLPSLDHFPSRLNSRSSLTELGTFFDLLVRKTDASFTEN